MKRSHLLLAGAALGSLVVAVTALPEPAHAVHRRFDHARNWTPDPAPYAFYGTKGTFFADVNGDGKADAIAVDADRIWVRVSNGCKFLPRRPFTSTPFYGGVGTFFADVNGDRKADAIAVKPTGVSVRLSTGDGFGSESQWTAAPFFGSRGTFFADVNGDGKADAIAVNNLSGVSVRLSQGSYPGFDSESKWTDAPFFGSRGTFFADVNGDGKADAIAVKPTGVSVRRAYWFSDRSPGGFDRESNWTAAPFYGSRGTFFADVTGDGRADAIAVNADGIAVRDSVGTGFRSPDANGYVTNGDLVIRPWGYWTYGLVESTRGTFFADVDGDRAADAIFVKDEGIWVSRSRYAKYEDDCGRYNPPGL